MENTSHFINQYVLADGVQKTCKYDRLYNPFQSDNRAPGYSPQFHHSRIFSRQKPEEIPLGEQSYIIITADWEFPVGYKATADSFPFLISMWEIDQQMMKKKLPALFYPHGKRSFHTAHHTLYGHHNSCYCFGRTPGENFKEIVKKSLSGPMATLSRFRVNPAYSSHPGEELLNVPRNAMAGSMNSPFLMASEKNLWRKQI